MVFAFFEWINYKRLLFIIKIMVKSSKKELFAKYPTKRRVNHLSTRCARLTLKRWRRCNRRAHVCCSRLHRARASPNKLTEFRCGCNFVCDCDATAMHCPRRCWIIYRVVMKYRIINSMGNSDWCSIYWNWCFDVMRRSGRARVWVRTWFVFLHLYLLFNLLHTRSLEIKSQDKRSSR